MTTVDAYYAPANSAETDSFSTRPAPRGRSAYGAVAIGFPLLWGSTGVWQASGRSDLPWDETLRLDLHHVENWSVGLDVSLLCKTLSAVIKPQGVY